MCVSLLKSICTDYNAIHTIPLQWLAKYRSVGFKDPCWVFLLPFKNYFGSVQNRGPATGPKTLSNQAHMIKWLVAEKARRMIQFVEQTIYTSSLLLVTALQSWAYWKRVYQNSQVISGRLSSSKHMVIVDRSVEMLRSYYDGCAEPF